jgi:hypothetical protein
MTDEELLALLVEKVSGKEGVYANGEMDLDVNVRGEGFRLWFDGDTDLHIPLDVNRENALRIQAAVRSLGLEIMHTWSMQYSVEI